MTMTSHLPLSAAQLALICRWMMPIVNEEKLGNGPVVDEAKVLVGIQRVTRRAPTFEDIKTVTGEKISGSFLKVDVDLPEGVAHVLADFLQRWEPTGLHCNQADCGLPALFARGNVLDEKRHGERCPHCHRGTVEERKVSLTVFDWIHGKEVPKDVMSISSGPQEYAIQPSDLEGHTALAILTILREKQLDVGHFLHWLLRGQHDLSIHRTPRAALEAIGSQGYLVSNLDSIAVAAYVDTAKGFKVVTTGTKIETTGGATPFVFIRGTGKFALLMKSAVDVLAEAYPTASEARAALMAVGFEQMSDIPINGASGQMWSGIVPCIGSKFVESLLHNAMFEHPNAGNYDQFRSDPSITWEMVQYRLAELSEKHFDAVRSVAMGGISFYGVVSYPGEANLATRAAQLITWCKNQPPYNEFTPQGINCIIDGVKNYCW